ncbi:hypothetical protein [Wolbachia sp. wLmal]|uniref:hypothetical protein n=1 Tax=Wolbachia sp. wLmal TaxID=3342489 RepID=UPI003C2F5DBA
MLCGAASVIGALTGLGLSFTALSTLVIGGIVAAVPSILFAACIIRGSVQEGTFSKKDLFGMAVLCVASAAIGVGLAAAATAIFPGAMLGMQSLALTGAVIGAIAPIAGCFVTDKVDNYIISPIVERFSSKREGYESL